MPVRVIPLLVLNVNDAVVSSAPPSKIILSASAEPGAVPKLLSAEIESVPELIVVLFV